MARDLSENEIIRRMIDARLLDVRTTMAGVVVSFDPVSMTASVRPAVRVQAVDSDSPAEVDTLPVLEEVPVHYPSAGAGILYIPLSPGDPVRIEWSEEDDGEFYDDEAAAVPVNPTQLKRHGGSCVCYPTGFRGANALGSESPTRTFLGSPGGTGISIGADVQLGDSTASAFVLTDAAWADFITWIKTGKSAAPGSVVTWETPAPSLSATKVKAK